MHRGSFPPITKSRPRPHQMYRWLAVFEPDEKRKTLMFGRRAAELSPVLEQLGKNAYADTMRQIAFEVA